MEKGLKIGMNVASNLAFLANVCLILLEEKGGGEGFKFVCPFICA